MAYSYTMYIQCTYNFISSLLIVKCLVHKILDARLAGFTTQAVGPAGSRIHRLQSYPLSGRTLQRVPRRSYWGPRWLLSSSKRELSEQEEKIEERKESRGRGECMRTSCQNR